MSSGIVKDVRIAGISSAVPSLVLTLEDDARIFGQTEIERISKNIGVERRHVVTGIMCTSDLCFAAANRLLDELGWDRRTVDALIFVTQTPDYIMPATACELQDRLGLAHACAAFDINQGCTGYVYGLWIGGLMARGGCRRLLLLVGDTMSRLVSPRDRTVTSLFGDAGTATALEYDEGAPAMYFNFGTDGSGGHCLSVPAGAFRHPHSPESCQRIERTGGNVRSDEDLFMDGGEVFTFVLREVPRLIESILSAAEARVDDIQAFVFHQANRFMLRAFDQTPAAPCGARHHRADGLWKHQLRFDSIGHDNRTAEFAGRAARPAAAGRFRRGFFLGSGRVGMWACLPSSARSASGMITAAPFSAVPITIHLS